MFTSILNWSLRITVALWTGSILLGGVCTLLLALWAIRANASEGLYFQDPGQPMTKIEAVKKALSDNGSIYRCTQVNLNDKLQFKNVNAKKRGGK